MIKKCLKPPTSSAFSRRKKNFQHFGFRHGFVLRFHGISERAYDLGRPNNEGTLTNLPLAIGFCHIYPGGPTFESLLDVGQKILETFQVYSAFHMDLWSTFLCSQQRSLWSHPARCRNLRQQWLKTQLSNVEKTLMTFHYTDWFIGILII